MKKLLILAALLSTTGAQAQFWKKKTEPADSTGAAAEKPKKGGGPNLFTRFVTKVAKTTGGGMQTTTVSDLSEVTPSAYYQTNLPPADLGTAEMAFYEGWKTGGNMVVLMFTKKNAYGFCKIDGTVTVDGKPAGYATMGVYHAFAADNGQPKKVEVVTKGGQRASFTLTPQRRQVRLLSINGTRGGSAAIDPAKELVLELDVPPGTEGSPVGVRLLARSVGIPYWSEIGYFPAAPRIVIPAAFLRNANNSNGSLAKFRNSYLSIECSSEEQSSNNEGSYGPISFATSFLDGAYLKINPDIPLSKGVQLKASANYPGGSVQYEFVKANAFSSRPIRQARTIAPLSVAVRGVLYDYSSKTSYNIGDQSYTQSTRSISFPQLPTAYWDALLENLYNDVSTVLQQVAGSRMLPVEATTKSEPYGRIADFSKEDENTSVAVSRGYKGLKVISAFVPVSEAWGPHNNVSRLLTATGADAALKLTLDLQPAWQGSKAVMVPKLGIELLGATNGPAYPTKFFSATVIGKGIPLSEGKAIDAAELDRLVRRSDLMDQFRKGLEATMAAEKEAADYDIVWPEKSK
ncbi:MAG: hypothetical protein EOO11_08410 [Chitinophagaceae bacterium]|nr:MAG: hypothetical protein EOO11_08410 [Chitinophagaceae bacterium]